MKNSISTITSRMQITKYIVESEEYSSNDGYYGIMEVDLTVFPDGYNVESATIFLR